MRWILCCLAIVCAAVPTTVTGLSLENPNVDIHHRLHPVTGAVINFLRLSLPLSVPSRWMWVDVSSLRPEIFFPGFFFRFFLCFFFVVFYSRTNLADEGKCVRDKILRWNRINTVMEFGSAGWIFPYGSISHCIVIHSVINKVIRHLTAVASVMSKYYLYAFIPWSTIGYCTEAGALIGAVLAAR